MGNVLFAVKVKPIYSSDKSYGRPTKMKLLRNGDIALKITAGLRTKLIDNGSVSRVTYKNAHTGVLSYQRSLTIELTDGGRASFRLLQFGNRMKVEHILAEVYGNRFSQA